MVLPLDTSEWTLVNLVTRQAAAHGDREFMTFEQGTRLTFASLDKDSDKLALCLSSFGVRSGDRVMALLKNRIEFLQIMIATMKLGAIFVPINTELKGSFLQHQMRNAAPSLILVDAVLADAFDTVEGGNENLHAIVYVAGPKPKNPAPVLGKATNLSFEEFLGVEPGDPNCIMTPSPEDIACIMYTSGTTGPSKGVLMPHAHCYLFGKNIAAVQGMDKNDCQYICMPLFHAMGLFLQVLSTLITGSKGYCVERFSANKWLHDVRSCGATVTTALGVITEFIYRTPPSDEDLDNKLRRVMAVPIAAEWGKAMETRFGFKFGQGYGMTEVNMPCYTYDDDPLLPGMAGHVMDEFEVRIVNSQTDKELPQGEIGEIIIRPKLPFCFNQGYFRMSERTVEAWRNLWFHTGDAGYFDKQKRLFYADRLKDRIRRRGENISSFEIEQLINDYPEISESAVVGIRVAGAGGEDEVKAYIVTDGGRMIDNVALMDYCVEHMPRFAVPRYVEAVTSLSKTATGKIQKESLRQIGITDRTWDRESIGYKIAKRIS